MITLTLKDFAAALAKAVKDKPKDYKYEAVDSVCLNFHPPQGGKASGAVGDDWTPGCIIGTAVVNAGVTMIGVAETGMTPQGNYSTLFNRLRNYSLLELDKGDEQAILSLASHAQFEQDGRRTWTVSVMKACDEAVDALEGRLTAEQVATLEALHAEIKEYAGE